MFSLVYCGDVAEFKFQYCHITGVFTTSAWCTSPTYVVFLPHQNETSCTALKAAIAFNINVPRTFTDNDSLGTFKSRLKSRHFCFL